MLFLFAESTMPDFLKFLFLLVLFFVRIWLEKALFLTILPVPVVLNLFAAPRFVFILGIFKPPMCVKNPDLWSGFLFVCPAEGNLQHESHFQPNSSFFTKLSVA